MNDKHTISRHINFHSMQHHAWFGRVYNKLTGLERGICMAFIEENKHLDKNEFELAVNRWFLDMPNKPRNWTMMQELVANANVKESL